MPEVPLTYPTTTPSQGGASPVNVNAPTEAFGGQVGAALAHLGQSVQADSDKIWERAVQIRDLQRRTEVDNADAQTMQEMGELHAKFTSEKGLNAGPEALEKLGKDLQDVRMRIRGTLSDDMARRLYDTQTLGTYGRTMFNAAGHSGNEVKNAAIKAKQDNADKNYGMAVSAPDDATYEMYRGQGNAALRKTHQLTGVPKEDGDTQEFKINSSLYSNRAQYIAENPSAGGVKGAKEYLEAHKDKMEGPDLMRAQKVVQSQDRAIGAANIANGVYDKGIVDKRQTLSQQEGEDEVRKQARAESDDPIFEQHAVANFITRWNQGVRAERYTEWGSWQIIDGAIQAGAKSEQELRADPQVSQAIKNLPASEQLKIPSRINTYNGQRDKYANDSNFYQLLKMSHNADDDVRAQFMNTDLEKQQLSDSQRSRLMARREQILKGHQDDPRVPAAMRFLNEKMGNQLRAIGVDRFTKEYAEDYNTFRASLSTALEDWQQLYGKPPSRKEITDEIGPMLLKEHTNPAFFGLTTRNEQDWRGMPEAFRSAYLADAAKRGAPTPSDEQMQSDYIRGLLRKLHPTTAKPDAK